MKLLDMEPGKIYETEMFEWRRTERGIEKKYKDGNLWGLVIIDIDVTEVISPHEWTSDELIRIGRATVKAFENENVAINECIGCHDYVNIACSVKELLEWVEQEDIK